MTLAFLAAFLPALAQDVPGEEQLPPPTVCPFQVLPAREGFMLTDRIAFVVDVSGSMKQTVGMAVKDQPAVTRLDQAIESVLMILGGSDDCQAAIFTFTGTVASWPGHPEECRHDPTEPCDRRRCVAPGWGLFPRRLGESRAWLRSFPGDGSTEPAAAVAAALRLQVEGLVVVFVSDGEFLLEPVTRAVVEGQAWRGERELPEAGVMVWGAGPKARSCAVLRGVAEVGGGGLWVHGDEGVSGPW